MHLLIAVAVAVLTIRWVFLLVVAGYGPCWRCNGTGRNRWSNSRRHGPCKHCKGSGRRLRFGARFVHKRMRGSKWG